MNNLQKTVNCYCLESVRIVFYGICVNRRNLRAKHVFTLPYLLLALSFLSLSVFAQSETNSGSVSFRAVDIYVDSKTQPLAAYQLDFSITNSAAKIAGIEGGEHPAFTEPPFYDPKAMQHERVILAAFSTNAIAQLPVGKTRVATIHLQTSGTAALEFSVNLQIAADANGNKIPAEASAQERKDK